MQQAALSAVTQHAPLNEKEREFLVSLACGLSTFEIAKSMRLSEHTVSAFESSIARKMNASGRSHALAKAIRDGIVQPHEIT